MSKLRDCIERGPELCGVSWINAKRWGKKYSDLFDADVAKEIDLFDLQEGETVEDRMDILNGLYMAKGADRARVHYWITLLQLAAYASASSKGNKEAEIKRDELSKYLITVEPQYPEIASVYSVADASTQGQWA